MMLYHFNVCYISLMVWILSCMYIKDEFKRNIGSERKQGSFMPIKFVQLCLHTDGSITSIPITKT